MNLRGVCCNSQSSSTKRSSTDNDNEPIALLAIVYTCIKIFPPRRTDFLQSSSRPTDRRLELGTGLGLDEALLGLVEVDDVPDGVEVLDDDQHHVREETGQATYVGLHVEVLEVECVLPDVDADDGNMRQERVLVRGGSNLKNLGRGVVSLESEASDILYPN